MPPIRDLATALFNLRYAAEAQPLQRMFEDDKRRLLADIARREGLATFVETGTYLGKTTALLAEVCARVITIEVDEDLHAKAAARFSDMPHVQVMHGDSADLIPAVLAELSEPTLFWLDGHYSNALTGRGKAPTPIEVELSAILRHRIKQHVIIIDDARLFRGRAGYPTLRHLAELVRTTSPYKIALDSDLIRVQREDI